jgi:hypothetical protein
MDAMLRCAHCGDVIGVYEPLVVVGEHGERRTSRAAEPRLSRERGRFYHLDCYAAEEDASAAEAAS